MIALLARFAAWFGVPPALVYLTVYGSIALVIGLSYAYAYGMGVSHANKQWKAKELDRIIYAQAETIARYRKAAEQTKEQADQEVRDAQARADLISERMKQAEAENAQMETQLATVITDKEKLNEVIRVLRSKCVATSRDVDLDKRLRNQQGNKRVPHTAVPPARRSTGAEGRH